jgi:uncharacterized iron-regulated protein
MPRRLVFALALGVALSIAACAGNAPVPAPRELPLWSVRESRFVDVGTLRAALRAARYRFIGEVHDNAAQHALRADLVASLADARPAAVMEIFDFGRDAELASAQTAGGDADAIASAGDLDRSAWRWPLHRPVVSAALAAGMPIRAANVARAELMSLSRARSSGRWQSRIDATPWSERDAAKLHRDIVESHCGVLPDAAVPALALAQRIRDAAMADAMASAARDAGGAVLLAGNGHVRRDVGAPRYLLPSELPRGADDIVAVAFVEASRDEMREPDFPRVQVAGRGEYDFVWFTPPVERPDPCESLRRRMRPPS